MSIPPTIVNGQATCPSGYGLSPDGSECLPISAPISVDVLGTAAQELDPAAAALLSARGLAQSGLIERAFVAMFSTLATIAAPLVGFAASLFDTFLASLAGFFFDAQGQRNAGYYLLIAALFTDLTGIDVDGAKLYSEFQSKGRVATMRTLGGALFNTLASEFVGETQTDAGSAWKITPGSGLGGLPSHAFQPGEGVAAASAMLGYATSFAVREGNTDMLADFLPWGMGRWFKDFGEDFSKSIGLGRLLRVALRPLMQVMVADPLQADLNTQYRPKLLSDAQAIKASRMGALSQEGLASELAMLGYSDARQIALQAQIDKGLSLGQLETLRAHGDLSDADFAVELSRLDYDPSRAQQIIRALDLQPARRLSLAYMDHYVLQYLEGKLTAQAIGSFLDGIGASGKFLVTPGELAGVRGLVSLTSSTTLRPRHLSVLTLQQAYIDGTITLDEFNAHTAALGYSADDQTILELETLIKAKDKQAAAAAKAAKGKTGTPTPASAQSPAPSSTPTGS